MIKLESLLTSVGDMALKRRARWIITQLQAKSGEKIVDLGCGNGYYLYLLDNVPIKNLSVVGIDSDANALQAVNGYVHNRNINLIKTDLERIPYPDNNFDKAIMSEVIEHVENPDKVLAEIRRVLKPDGTLLLTTPNINYPFFWDPVNWFLQRVFHTHIKSGFWAGIWNQHLRLYTKDQISELIIENGFIIDQLDSLTQWCLPFNHYLVNFIARLFYGGNLPPKLARTVSKFESARQPLLIKLIYWLINTYDSLNNIWTESNGVSLVIKAHKHKEI